MLQQFLDYGAIVSLCEAMTFFELIHHFSYWDAAAVAYLFIAWCLIGWLIENPPKSRPSTAVLMSQYRRHWMTHMIDRQPRIFDMTLLSTLRDGTAFLGSACLIAIGGCLAAIANGENLKGLAAEIAIDAPVVVWDVKISVTLIFVASAFMKFVWSNRLFGYCGVMMAAVPNDFEAVGVQSRTHKAAEINISAARAYNRGLRCVYFAIGSLGWFIGPVGLFVTASMALTTLVRREFASVSRAVLLEPDH